MIVKPLSDRDDVERLEKLRAAHPGRAKDIDAKIRKRRSGEKGERDAARMIDATLGATKNYAVLHDLRIETPSGFAQFDHVIVGRLDHFTILETKRFHAGVKITEEGEFLRWSNWERRYEGMESPLMQCDRHEHALSALCAAMDLMPKRLGFRIKPTIKSYVLVNPEATIQRPKDYDTSRVVKADQFFERMTKDMHGQNPFGAVGDLARVLGSDTIVEMAQALAEAHRPARHDYAAMLGIKEEPTPTHVPSPQATSIAPVRAHVANMPSTQEVKTCRTCGSATGEIRYGKFGYYWKCLDCDGNTKLALPGPGRLRKDGPTFTYVALDGSETPFHVNG